MDNNKLNLVKFGLDLTLTDKKNGFSTTESVDSINAGRQINPSKMFSDSFFFCTLCFMMECNKM